MTEIKSIQIVFENCEYVKIPANVIAGLSITGIKRIIRRITANCIAELQVAKHVFLEIFPEADKLGVIHPLQNEYGVIERLTKWKDITSITVYYSNGQERTLYVDYDEGNNDYLGAPNVNQISYVSTKGVLYITISGKHGLSDYVDREEIESSEYVDTIRNLYDIGKDQEEDATITIAWDDFNPKPDEMSACSVEQTNILCPKCGKRLFSWR